MRVRTTAIVFALILALALAPAALAADNTPPAGADPVGTAAMMDIGMNARALGMGGAHIAVADDGSAIYYNPAGLGLLSAHNITSLYTSQFGAAGYMALGYAQRYVGAGFLRLDASDIEETDEFANVTDVFGVTDLTAIAGAGFPVVPELSLGAAVKYYQQSLPDNSGWGVTGDVGILWAPTDYLRVGAVGRNLLGSIKYKGGSTDKFDPSWGAGVAFRPMPNLLIAADAVFSDMLVAKVGAEYKLGMVALRAGGSWGKDTTSLSAGAGFSVSGFSIDYAYQTHNILPDSHRLSLSVRF